nr:class I SAM-dependent methyltransferase [candidate division Zixibacteria bacterium]
MTDEKPWHESDEFWEIAGQILFAQPRITEASETVDKIIRLLNPEPELKVLDLCCGVGRHCIEFARRGFTVTGVDRTTSYLEKAGKRAIWEGLEIDFVREDMRLFRRESAFNLAVNLFTSFGFFEDPEDDRRVAENIYHSLKPGGVFLLEMMGKEINARIFQPRGWNKVDDVYILEEREVIDGYGGIKMKWIIIKDEKINELELIVRLYSAAELKRLLTGCGFNRVDIYGGLDGSPYDHQAKRMAAVAHK